MPNNVRVNRVNCLEGRPALAQNAAIEHEIGNPGKVSNRPGRDPTEEDACDR
jgi:hypothetical protein